MNKTIKCIRNLKGYTQEEVANSIGMTSRTFCKKESNPLLFTVGEFLMLSELFKVDVSIFFKDELTVTATKG